MVDADHHNNHGMIASLAVDADTAHKDHAAQHTEIDGMCCASNMFSCATVAVLAIDHSLMSPLHFTSAHTSFVDNTMIDGLIHSLERPPRFS